VSDKGSSSCTSKSESHVTPASNADTILASSSIERVSGENLPQAIAPIMSSPSQNVSPAFTDVLKFPKAKQSASKSKQKRIPLPKAISGKKFHDLLEQNKFNRNKMLKKKHVKLKLRNVRKSARSS
jgi:hypothetical protein